MLPFMKKEGKINYPFEKKKKKNMEENQRLTGLVPYRAGLGTGCWGQREWGGGRGVPL